MNTDKLRALLAAATPGPWEYGKMSGLIRQASSERQSNRVAVSQSNPDAALIVEVRNSLPALLDRLDKLEAVAEAAEKLAKTLEAEGEGMAVDEALKAYRAAGKRE